MKAIPLALEADVLRGLAGPRRIESTAAEPVDLLATAGSPVLKRVVPLLVVLALVLWLLLRWA